MMSLVKAVFVLLALVPLCYGQAGQVNHAAATNGATCTSSIGNCNGAIDGVWSQLNSNKWEIKEQMGNKGTLILNQWIEIKFASTVTIQRVLIQRTYFAVERNCKTMFLQFNGGSKTVTLPKGNDGHGVFIEFGIIATQTDRLNVTCTEAHDPNRFYAAIEEIEVYSNLQFTTPSLSKTTATTTTTTTTANTTTTTTAPTITTAPPPPTPAPITPAPVTPRATTPTTSTTTPTTTTTTTPTTTTSTTTTTTAPTPPTTTTTTTTTTAPPSAPPPTTTTTTTTTTAPTPHTTPGNDEGTVGDAGNVKAKLPLSETEIIILAVVLSLVFLIVLLVIIVCCCCCCGKKKGDPENPPDPAPTTRPPSIVTTGGLTKLEVFNDPLEEENLASQPAALGVKVKDLPQYVKERNYQAEFKSVPSGVIATATAGNREANKEKNRYGNIVPYDGNRVVLTTMASDPDSTYINASFIDGYKGPKEFIAAQGPKPGTIADFWRMIWEQNCTMVLMVTNCVEKGKTKCEQYWPSEGSKDYNNVAVSLESEDVGTDFTIRKLKLMKADEHRSVTQYHYTSWPDEGVPDTATALIQYTRRVRADATAASYTNAAPAPLVVHCSAGVGRTGTYIALSTLIDQAKEEKMVDIITLVHTLRTKRPNMIQSLEQYTFLHHVLLEALYCPDGVSIPCPDFPTVHRRLQDLPPGKTDTMMETQFEILDVFKDHRYHEKCKVAEDEVNLAKIRNKRMLPGDNHRAFMLALPGYPSTFANAVFTKGYKSRNDIMMAQTPFPADVIDIYRLLSDFDCRTVVRLNPVTEEAPSYLPEESGEEAGEEAAMTLGPFAVRRLSEETHGDVIITDLEITSSHRKSEIPQRVRHFQLQNWDPNSQFPESDKSLIALHDHVVQWKRGAEKKRILVHCLDGGHNTGLFCCGMSVLEKMTEEQKVDVFNAVKNTRHGRPAIIPNFEYYEFLYNLAAQRLAEFDEYANYK